MKKKVQFKVDDRVVVFMNDYDEGLPLSKIRYQEYAEIIRGTIAEITDKGISLTSKQVDDDIFFKPEEIIYEADFDKKYSQLEKDFESVQEDIKVKMKEAAAIIIEANKMAKKVNCNLSEMYGATGILENAMDKCGWRSSSWGC